MYFKAYSRALRWERTRIYYKRRPAIWRWWRINHAKYRIRVNKRRFMYYVRSLYYEFIRLKGYQAFRRLHWQYPATMQTFTFVLAWIFVIYVTTWHNYYLDIDRVPIIKGCLDFNGTCLLAGLQIYAYGRLVFRRIPW